MCSYSTDANKVTLEIYNLTLDTGLMAVPVMTETTKPSGLIVALLENPPIPS